MCKHGLFLTQHRCILPTVNLFTRIHWTDLKYEVKWKKSLHCTWLFSISMHFFKKICKMKLLSSWGSDIKTMMNNILNLGGCSLDTKFLLKQVISIFEQKIGNKLYKNLGGYSSSYHSFILLSLIFLLNLSKMNKENYKRTYKFSHKENALKLLKMFWKSVAMDMIWPPINWVK